jgi:hypothetical protein
MNNFRFMEDHYLQIQGTAMGTRMAPSYAILFMAALEERLLATSRHKPTTWLRYIDDILIIWNQGEDKLKEFLAHLNNHHATIKFTHEYSREQVNFLDVVIHRRGHSLETSLYSKPTDARNYLHYESYHPRTTLQAIPFSQFLRIKRICSTKYYYDQACHLIYRSLQNRGYPETTLNQAKEKVWNYVPSMDNTSSTIPLVVDYHPKFKPLKEVENHKTLLEGDDTTPVAQAKYITAYRKHTNIRNLLVRSDLLPPQRSPWGMYQCGKCQTCQYVHPSQTFKSTITGKEYKIRGHYDCNTTGAIYLLTCQDCNIQYVGQTGNAVKIRWAAHLHDVRYLDKTKPVSGHSYDRGHKRYKVVCIQGNLRDNSYRIRTEETWIQLLKTHKPHGLNIRE